MKRLIWATLLLASTPLFAAPDPLKRVAIELADKICLQKDAKVAVLTVPHQDSHISEGSLMVSERLANYLVGDKRLSVIERNHLLQVLSELHLSETGILNPETTKLIGKLLGADILITGTLIDLNDGKCELNVRGVRSDSGRIVATTRAVLDRTWGAPPLLENASGKTVLDWAK